MSKSASPEPRESTVSLTSQRQESNGAAGLDDTESTMATVAQFIEQLHTNMSSAHEKELVTTRLLSIAKARKDARMLIGSHSQAMPLFISILRSGTSLAKVNVAMTLSILGKDEELRLRVLGGCTHQCFSLFETKKIVWARIFMNFRRQCLFA